MRNVSAPPVAAALRSAMLSQPLKRVNETEQMWLEIPVAFGNSVGAVKLQS